MWLHWCRWTGRDSASRCARSSAPKRHGRALGELGDPHGRSIRDLMSLIDVRERPLARPRWAGSRTSTPRTTCARPDQRGPRPGWRHRHPEPTGPPSMKQGAKPMMQTWIDAVCTELNLPADVDIDVILDLARVSAHRVERPAAPCLLYTS